MNACYCVAQCPQCGACCQVKCGHARPSVKYAPRPWDDAPAIPPRAPRTPRPVTEEDVRRILREELSRARGDAA